MRQDHVIQAKPGYLSFDIVPPFWFHNESLNTTIGDAFVVGGVDGVVRTNIYLRQSWTGSRVHFRVAVRDGSSDVTGNVADVTVCCVGLYIDGQTNRQTDRQTDR